MTIKVHLHPSGNRTLMERVVGSNKPFKDCKSPLARNSNAAKFYWAVAKRIAKRAKKYNVSYRDTSQP
jgi:hypothetical protein